MEQEVLKVTNLKKRYKKTNAVNGISFSLNKGEIVALTGPNGAGKTTTIKCILGLLRKSDGKIFINGENNNSKEVKYKLAYIPETPDIYPMLTIWEHLKFMAMVYKINSFLTEPINSKEKEAAWMDLVKVLDDAPNLNIPEELRDSVDMDEEEWKTIQNRITENLKNDNYDNKAYNIKSTTIFDMSEEEQGQFEVFCTYIKPEGNVEIIGKTLEAVDKNLSVLSSRYRKRKEAHLKFDEEFQEKFKEEYFGEEPSMTLNIVHKETMSFVGIHYTKFINKKEFPKFIREFNNRVVEISNAVNGEKIYGFSGIDSLGKDIVPDSIFSFVFAVQVSNIEKVPYGMISFVLPQHEYIFYKHVGYMKDYQKSVNEVFMYNLEEQNYEMDILPSFQIFPSDIRDNDEKLEVEMYFPVSKTKKIVN